MSENSQRHAHGRAPLGLLGMMVLVVCVEATLARHELLSFTTNVAVSWRITGQSTRRAARQGEILCFGDSMVKFGVEPRVLEHRLHKRAYNLALYAGPPPASFFLLRRALESGAKPQAVVVDFQPHILVQPPQYFKRQWPELVSWRDCADLGWTTRDASFFTAVALAHLMPSYRDRYEIRANVFLALAGQSYSNALFAEIPPLLRNWNRNQGAQAAPRNPANTGAVDTKDQALFPNAWTCDRFTGKYVRRFLRLAQAHHVPVFWLMPPICPTATTLREQMGLEALYTAYVQGLQRQFPGVIVFDGRGAGYPHTVYQDPVHLDHQGAATLSRDVADLLDFYLNGPPDASRWAALPHFQDRPSDVPLEDVTQSRVALKMQ